MRESYRIGLVTLSASAGERGGVEVLNDQLRRALGDVEVFEDRSSRPLHASGGLHRLGLEQPYRAVRAVGAFLRRHRESPFDLVITNGMAGWPLALARLSIPAIQLYHLTVAGLAARALTERGDRFTTRHVTARFDRLAGVGKHVVAVSPRVLREVHMFYGLSGGCIPPGIDTSLFVPLDRRAAREDLGLPQDEPIGLFVGRPDPLKGYDTLLQVAARLPRVHFVVAGGSGVARENVRPVGRIPHEQMPQWYAACDFLLHPSRYEGFNLVILEALSCDRPVVASLAAFSLPEDASRCGVVVAGDEIGDYVRGIQNVLRSGPLHTRGVVVPRYSQQRFAASWRALVDSLIGADSRPGGGLESRATDPRAHVLAASAPPSRDGGEHG